MGIEEMVSEPVQSELPTGWISIQVKDAILNIATTDKKILQKSYLDAGLYPVIDQGQSHIGGYTNDEKLLLDVEPPTIVFGDHTKIVKYVSQQFAPGADGIKVLKPYPFTDTKFIYYTILHTALNIKTMGYARHYQHLAKSNIGIPPLAEQQRIVAKIEELFSELDKGVENLRTAQQQLKVYRQALLKHAFEGKLTADWRAQNPDKLESADALLARIQQEREARYQQQLQEWQAAQRAWEANGKTGSKPSRPKAPKALPPLTAEELATLPKLPAGWSWTRLGNTNCNVSDGPFGSNLKGSDYVASGVRVIRLENIGELEFFEDKRSFISEEKYKTISGHTVKHGDIIFSSFINEAIRTALLPKNIDRAINKADCFCVRLYGESLSSEYAVKFLATKHVFKQLESLIHGVGRPRINTSQLKDVFIPICSPEEQGMVVSVVELQLSELEQLEQTITHSLQQADALRQSILKKAFSGQLVAQDPNDEPASVLLERIRAERVAQPKARGRTARALA